LQLGVRVLGGSAELRHPHRLVGSGSRERGTERAVANVAAGNIQLRELPKVKPLGGRLRKDPPPDLRALCDIGKRELRYESDPAEVSRIEGAGRQGEFVRVGLACREKPRLANEAVRGRSAGVDVEDSMTAFAKSLGIEPNRQQLKALKDQFARLAASTVRMGIMEEARAVCQVLPGIRCPSKPGPTGFAGSHL
jgi:hypothetical protein